MTAEPEAVGTGEVVWPGCSLEDAEACGALRSAG